MKCRSKRVFLQLIVFSMLSVVNCSKTFAIEVSSSEKRIDVTCVGDVAKDINEINAAKKAVSSLQHTESDTVKIYFTGTCNVSYGSGNDIDITGLHNVIFENLKVHAKASQNSYTAIWIKNSSNLTFNKTKISSDYDYFASCIKDANGACTDGSAQHYHPEQKKYSGVNGFSGFNNQDITFKNNTFERLNIDYRLVGESGETELPWKNVSIDGWYSGFDEEKKELLDDKENSSTMPMHTKNVENLEIKNAYVRMYEYAGDGAHCLYISTKTVNISISDSYFYYDGEYFPGQKNPISVLTFHSGNDLNSSNADLQPKGITITNTKISSGTAGRAIWSLSPEPIKIENSILLSDTNGQDQFGTYTYLLHGSTVEPVSYEVKNSILKMRGDYITCNLTGFDVKNSYIEALGLITYTTRKDIANKTTTLNVDESSINTYGEFLYTYNAVGYASQHSITNSCIGTPNRTEIAKDIYSLIDRRTTNGLTLALQGNRLQKVCPESEIGTDGDEDGETEMCKNPTITEEQTIEMKVGDQDRNVKSIVNINPSDCGFDNFAFKTTDATIAYVDANGKIYAAAPGTAIITVEVKDDNDRVLTTQIIVNVAENKKTEEGNSGSETDTGDGGGGQPGDGGSGSEIEPSSGEDSDDKTESDEGDSGSDVEPPSSDSGDDAKPNEKILVLTQSQLELNLKDTLDLSSIIDTGKSNVELNDLVFRLSNNKAVVSNKILTANETGSVVLSIYYRDDTFLKTLVINIIDSSSSQKVTEINLNINNLHMVNGANLKINSGDKLTVVTTVVPETANKNLVWKSDNPSIASVQDGVIETKNTGNVRITVTDTLSGVSTFLLLNVEEDKPEVKECNPYLSYTTTNQTTESVGVTLNFENKMCKSDESYHIFDENGSYTFEYTNKNGKTEYIDAKVTWINKNINNPKTGSYTLKFGLLACITIGDIAFLHYLKKRSVFRKI